VSPTCLNAALRATLPGGAVAATPLPLCPEISLYLVCPENMQRRFSIEETQAILRDAPYWIFCWASGHAMAAHILAHRADFQDRVVMDFGAGSGVVAIAAALAGARRVYACDIDPRALEAIEANAALNGVTVTACKALEEVDTPVDILVAADVLYDRANLYLLDLFRAQAPCVLIADSRLKSLDNDAYTAIAEVTTTTVPDLDEPAEFNCVRLYRTFR